MAAFVLSNVTGLVRQILVSRAFGTDEVIDAFNAASTYPDVLFNLVAGGALASAFVPTLTGFLAHERRSDAWRLSSAILNLVFFVLTLTSLLSAIFAGQIVRNLLAPQFTPGSQALSAELLRILLLAPAIFGVSGLLMGILNAHQVFLWPALAPSMYWLGMIVGVLFFSPSLGIHGLAWGAVLGAALHLIVQLPAYWRLPGRRYIFTLGLNLPSVWEVAHLMGPRLLGVAVVQINFVINTILATGQSEGSLTAIKYAWAIMTMPQVVIAQAIAIAALPTFSAQAARGELDDMRASLAVTLRGVIALALPAALGLILLRAPLVAFLFQRGEFDVHSTRLVAWALLWYTSGLVSHSVVEIVARAFYALHDTRTPVIVGAGAMSLNILFSLGLVRVFNQIGWMPHGGLALANTLATTLEMAGLLYLMRRRLNGIGGYILISGLFKTSLATGLMCLAIIVWLQFTTAAATWLVGLGGVLLGAGVFVLSAWLVRAPEAVILWQSFRARLSVSAPAPK